MFQLPEGTRLSERVEARNRLLQTYDKEVTIRRTLSRASRTGGFQAAEEKTRGKTTGQPSFLSPVSETPALRRRCWLRRWRWGRSRRRLNWRTRWRRNGRSLRFCRSGRSSRCGLLFHQLTPERALPAGAPMSVQNRQPKREREENASEPGGKFHQHVRGLCAENVFRDTPAKCGAQAFAFWTLH
jgi:hypothetical protein